MDPKRRGAAIATIALFVIAGCGTDPEASAGPTTAPPLSAGSQPSDAPVSAAPSAGDPVAASDALQPGTFAAVVTDDLVLRSAPGTAPESEIFPDSLNAPMTVYVADGPVAADGYEWYLVEGIRDGEPVGPWSGWVAAAGKDGEVWLEPMGHAGGTWTMGAADGPVDVDSASGAMTSDGRVLLVGSPVGPGEPHGDAWIYDQHADAWQQVASATTPVQEARSTGTEDGLVFVFPPSNRGLPGDAIVHVFDTETGRWQTLGGPPAGSGVPVTAAGGQIYVIGRDGVQAYDRSTRTWETMDVELDPAIWPSSAAPMTDGSILAIGDGGPIVRIDPVGGTVETVAEPRMTRYGAATVIGPDGRLYVIGGSVQGRGATCGPRQMPDRSLFSMRLVEAYDFAADEWTTVAPLPAVLSSPSAVATDDGILVIGTDDGGRVQAARLELPELIAEGPLSDAEQELPEARGCGM